MAVASLVLGIVSVVFCWCPWLGIIASIVALVLGIIKLIKLKKEEEPKGKGMSIAGLITGGIGFIASIIFLLITIIALSTVGNVIESALGKGTVRKRDSLVESIENTFESSNSTFNSKENSLSDLKKKYSIGETANINGLKVTVKNISDFVSTDEYFQPSKGKKYIKVEIAIENNGKDDEEYVSSSDFSCYADNASVSDEYCGADDIFYGSDVPIGKNASGSIYYEVPEDTKTIEIRYSYYSYDSFETINIVFSNK